MAKKLYEQLGEELFNSSEEVSTKKINKADFDKSYKTTIVGCNRYFTDDVPAETQAELIKKYNIPEVSVSGVYYTFRINGNWYVKSSNNDFKLYEEVVVRVPNGNWDNMFIEVQRDTVSEGGGTGGVGKNVGGGSEIFNCYSGDTANSIQDSIYAHAEGGENNISNSSYAHAEGDFNSIRYSEKSHAEGESSKIFDSKWAHAGGYGCYIMSHADCGFAHGYGAKVTGGVAAAFGSQTLAAGRNQFVAGKGNIEDSEDKYALIIGNGTDDLPRGYTGFEASNALTLDWEGNLWVAGSLNYSGGTVTNYTAGRGIKINKGKIGINIASENVLGGVKVGKGLKISADGTLETNGGGNYTSGDGIEITKDDVINVKQATGTEIGGIILGEGLEYDAATGKTNTVPNIQQAVIITEADAKYLLHEYTQIEYIAGNKIGYAGAQNQIIAQGLITYNKSTMTTGTMAAIPNYQYYTDVSFEKPVFLAYGSYIYDINRIYYRYKASYNTYDQYELVFVKTDGTEVIYSTINAYRTYSEPVCKFAFGWENIYPPGYSPTENQFCEYGCAYALPMLLVSNNSDASKPYTLSQIGNSIYIPYIQFATEAEYNAAVGLTYEPQTLVNVEETITEV